MSDEIEWWDYEDLAEMAISFPDFGPRSAQLTAKKNVGVISGFLIRHAFAIGDVSDQLTGFEYAR